MKGRGEKRSRKAEQFIGALLSHRTIEAAAKSVGINNAAAWRRMQDPAFRGRYQQDRREIMHHTTSRLQEAAQEAVECLRAVQRDGQSEWARVSAARTILEQAVKAVDLEDLTTRVEVLERVQSGKDWQ